MQSNQIEADDPDTTSTVVINCFPSGSPGGSIPGMPCGTSTHESGWDTSMKSMWAPFWSQKDWEIMHWVKMCNSSSLDVDSLMAVLDVHFFFLIVYCL